MKIKFLQTHVILIILLSNFFVITSLSAQAPQGISHQAVIRNASNVLVTNSPVGIKVSILQGSASGVVVYSETHSPTSNANGLISFVIGQGTIVSGVFANINWAAGPYFIKTEADPAGGTSYTITGISQMLSVPYALYAKTAQTTTETDPVYAASPAKNITNSQIDNWNSAYSNRITSASGTSPLSLNISSNQLTGSIAVASASTSGYLHSADWNTFNNKENPLTITNGLTRTANAVKLGGNLTENTTITQDANEALTLTNNGTANTTINLSGTGDFQIQDNGAALFTASDDGKIGIGTTTPGQKLTISDGNFALSNSGTAGEMMFYEPGVNGSNYTSLRAQAQSANVTYTLPEADGASGQLLSTNGSGVLSWSSAGSGNQISDADSDTKIQVERVPDEDIIRFDVAGTNKMQIDNTGLVMPYTTSSNTGVIYKGSSPFIHNFKPAGNDGKNTFVGENAGNFTMSGANFYSASSNSALGYWALKSNTTGLQNTASGCFALTNNTSGSENTAGGANTLYNNISGLENAAFGYSALRSNTTGNYNSATGSGALYASTSGHMNTANGYAALTTNTTGTMNTGVGSNAGSVNTIGCYNTFVGAEANASVNNLLNSTAIGYGASVSSNNQIVLGGTGITGLKIGTGSLATTSTDDANLYYDESTGFVYRSTTGSSDWNITGNAGTISGINFIGTTDDVTLRFRVNNTGAGRIGNSSDGSVYLGYQAGVSDDGLNNMNVAIGYQSLACNISGFENCATGNKALYNQTLGGYNTANGAFALYSSKANSRTTAIGYNAMYFADNRTAGRETYNTAVGYEALMGSNTAAVNTGRENTAVGDQALYGNTSGESNTASGRGALYTNTTGSSNTANGRNALMFNTIGSENTAHGRSALFNNTIGSFNTASGRDALYGNTTGNNNTGYGYEAGLTNNTGSGNTYIGAYADGTSANLSNVTAIGNNAKVNASNKVVIGNASASTVGGYGAWTNYSDRRLKENIAYNEKLGLGFIMKLRTVSYNYREDENKRRRDGLIAQDVQQVLKELGLDFSGLVVDDDKDQTLNLSYDSFVIPLINGMKEQQSLIENQKAEIEQQRMLYEKQQRIIEELLLRLEKLENDK